MSFYYYLFSTLWNCLTLIASWYIGKKNSEKSIWVTISVILILLIIGTGETGFVYYENELESRDEIVYINKGNYKEKYFIVQRGEDKIAIKYDLVNLEGLPDEPPNVETK